MKLVVGLGNPGRQYAGTRHNVGFDAVDLLAGRHALSWEAAPRGIDALSTRWNLAGTLVAKPLTFMNRSGEAIVGLLQFYKIEVPDLLVIVDEIQLEAGRIRLRPSGSAGGHNGLKSIIQSLGTDAFPRLTDEDKATLEELNLQLAKAGDASEHFELRERFYSTLYGASAKPRMVSMILNLHNQLAMHLRLQRVHDSAHAHEELMETIRADDVERACALVRLHLTEICARSIEGLQAEAAATGAVSDAS